MNNRYYDYKKRYIELQLTPCHICKKKICLYTNREILGKINKNKNILCKECQKKNKMEIILCCYEKIPDELIEIILCCYEKIPDELIDMIINKNNSTNQQ